MAKNFQEDSGDRKDFRRKQLKNKFLDKKDQSFDDRGTPKFNRELKRKKEHMKEEEIWEDWKENYKYD